MRVAQEAADYENAAVNNSDTAVEAADKKENEITNYKLVARKMNRINRMKESIFQRKIFPMPVKLF